MSSNPNRKKPIAVVYGDVARWWCKWGRNWDRVLDFLKEVKKNPTNQAVLEELVELYARVDKGAEGECMKTGACCINDIDVTFLEYLYFMTPFLIGKMDSDSLGGLYIRIPYMILDKGKRGDKYQPACTFLFRIGREGMCLSYNYRPLSCRAILPKGDCKCEFVPNFKQYDEESRNLDRRLEVPKPLHAKLATLTRGWPMAIQTYLSDKEIR